MGDTTGATMNNEDASTPDKRQLERMVIQNRNKGIEKATRAIYQLGTLCPDTRLQVLIARVHERILKNHGLNPTDIKTSLVTDADYYQATLELMEEIE